MRKHFIDNLRWAVIILLIPYHAAQAFNTWGELNYICFEPSRVISSLIVFLSPFYMPLMFLLAGMSARYSLDKRSYGRFVTERVKRLLVPFVFGTLVFCPILAYLGDKNNFGYSGGFFEHYRVFFTKWTDLSGFDGGFAVGQFWFLYYLFVISVVGVGIAVLIRKIAGPGKAARDLPFPVVCAFAVPLPLLYGLLSVGGKSFAEYLYVFLIGFYVLANDAAIDKLVRYRHITLAVGLAACIVNTYMFVWSGRDFGVANTIAKAFAQWFMLLALIGIGKRWMNRTGRVSAYLSARSFLFFSFHFVWIVLFQRLFSDLLADCTALLYILPIVPAYIATFICSEIAARIPALCFLLGAKPKPQARETRKSEAEKAEIKD